VAAGRYLNAATIYSGHNNVGHVFGHQGTPSWMFLTIEAAAGSGTYEASWRPATGSGSSWAM